MTSEEIRTEQQNPHASLDNLKPLEAALWEISWQQSEFRKAFTQKIDALIATVEKVSLRNGGGR